MKTRFHLPTIAASLVLVFVFLLIEKNTIEEHVRHEIKKMSRVERKKARDDFFHRMYRYPATGEIPPNVRNRELAFVENIPQKASIPGSNIKAATWTEVGPNNVGGRTRGLAVDVDNSNNIVTGGVNGGIWKSTDKGTTWVQKSRSDLGVTSIAQDVRAGNTSTWYAGTGEASSSAGNQGTYFGEGFWKSTDDAETWTCIQGCSPDLLANSEWDRIDRVAVSPTTGTVIVGSNSNGIYRSNNGGASFTQVRSGDGNTDIDVHPNGRMLAAIGGAGANIGLAVSTDDGLTWTAQTMASTGDFQRGVVAFANSDATGNTAYSLVFTGEQIEEGFDRMRLDILDTGENTAVDRSANVPRLGVTNIGYFNTQETYNMLIEVHPADPNHVFLGGTNLYRSRDGFATAIPNNAVGIADGWIGGFSTIESVASYENHHPDCHYVVFDPNDVNAMWSTHDGGISYVADIRPSIADGFTVPWVDRNAGYNVTQFYQISQHPAANDTRLAGGLQDNGTPFFRSDNGAQIEDITTGDGGFAILGTTIAVAEAQMGNMQRYSYDGTGLPVYEAFIKPEAAPAMEFMFIHPYEINPSNENVFVTPVGSSLWRNNDLANSTTTVGWSQLTNVTSGGVDYSITTLAHSQNDRLYYASTDFLNGPRMFRLDNASSATDGEVEISDAAWPEGAYPGDIAVDPDNANTVAVVFPNYNVPSIWISFNGGTSWTNETGNLGGAQMGPSVRAIEIVTTAAGKELYVGTSTGIYSAPIVPPGAERVGVQSMATWSQDAAASIGNTPVTDLHYRSSDNRMAVATHGRGAWIGQVNPLPVELSSLTASLDGDDVNLSWSTSTETNNSGFEVQSREKSGAWSEIGFVEGAGSTLETQDYDFVTTLEHAGRHYFRLKQIDFDGAFEYSPSVEVFKEMPGSHQLGAAYPNPFNPNTSFTIQVREEQQVKVTVHDISGRLVQTLFNGRLAALETKQLHIEGSSLSSGSYLYRVVGRDFNSSRQVTLLK